MLAFVQSAGETPVSKDCWKMTCTTGAKVSAWSCSTVVGIMSGPTAFFGLRAFKSFITPLVVTTMSTLLGHVYIYTSNDWQQLPMPNNVYFVRKYDQTTFGSSRQHLGQLPMKKVWIFRQNTHTHWHTPTMWRCLVLQIWEQQKQLLLKQ